MSTYLDFLKFLVALGPKFPQILLIVQDIVAKVQEAIAVIKGPQPLNAVDFDVCEAEIEQEQVLIGMCAGDGVAAIGDGTLLRSLWAFLNANPALMTLILSLITR